MAAKRIIFNEIGIISSRVVCVQMKKKVKEKLFCYIYVGIYNKYLPAIQVVVHICFSKMFYDP